MLPPASDLIVQPDDGMAPVLDFIGRAREHLLIKQFTFTQPDLMRAVVDRKNAGVAVRVMLNPQRSGGDRANDATFDFFQNAGVAVKWASSRFYVTHEKSIVVDGTAAMIATFNLCEKYFTLTRDYGVVVRDAEKVTQVAEGFQADWDERDDWRPSPASGLLWSNHNAREDMARFIDSARDSLWIQHPKFVDATILDRIAEAAHRGVDVRVLCGGKRGISEWDLLDTFSSLRIMRRAGVAVHKQKNLRMHAKLLVADRARAIVGSMNIDRSAFDLRRELGARVDEAGVVGRLLSVFEQDWSTSHPYEAPDPLDPSRHHEKDSAPDCGLSHE